VLKKDEKLRRLNMDISGDDKDERRVGMQLLEPRNLIKMGTVLRWSEIQ
jgi:hypothetical protein